LLRAVKILISRCVGEKEPERVTPYVGAALQLAIGLGCCVMGLGFVAAQFLHHVTESEESGRLAGEFLSIRMLASVGFLCLIVIQEVRQGQGDSRTAMFTTLFGNLMNIALDYLLVIHLELGVRGAAWASTSALTLEFLVLAAVHVRKHGFPVLLGTPSDRQELLRLGIPTGIQFGLEVSAFAILVLILSSYSERHAAAHQIAIQVLHFCFLPAMALGEAGSVLVGQAHGAGRPELTPYLARLTLKFALGYATLCGIVLLLGARPIVGAFTQDPALFALTCGVFWILPLFQLVDAANIVGRSLLRGAGDVRFVAVAGILTAWVFTPPLTWYLGRTLGWGVYGAWLGLSAELMVVTALLWHRLLATPRWATPLPAPGARSF
jgi:multidrug resistance protein, MATE family